MESLSVLARNRSGPAEVSKNDLKVFAGNSHLELADRIVKNLGVELGNAKVSKFSDKETRVFVRESVRQQDVFILQSGCGNVNDHLMELLIMVSACNIASAARVTAVVPCFPYARQDKKGKNRAPVSAKLVASMVEVAGADRVITLDLHAAQIQGFFDIPVDDISAEPSILKYISEHFDINDITIVSPSALATKRASSVAEALQTPFAMVHRPRNASDDISLVGTVDGRVAVVVNDLADTCDLLVTASEKLKDAGAKEVHVIATHGLLSGNAIDDINASCIKTLVVTNSVPTETKQRLCPKLRVIDIAPVLAEAIRRTHHGESILYLCDHVPN